MAVLIGFVDDDRPGDILDVQIQLSGYDDKTFVLKFIHI